jgi:fibronectin-binding autotransporter adhesin
MKTRIFFWALGLIVVIISCSQVSEPDNCQDSVILSENGNDIRTIISGSGKNKLAIREILEAGTVRIETHKKAIFELPGESPVSISGILETEGDVTLVNRHGFVVSENALIESCGRLCLRSDEGDIVVRGKIRCREDAWSPKVELAASNVIVEPGSLIEVPGGIIEVWGFRRTAIKGLLSADSTGKSGGTVNVFGKSVELVGARVSANSNGSTAGFPAMGNIRIGGGSCWFDPTFPNSQDLYIDSESVIACNSGDYGDGGTAVLWSEQSTVFNGRIEARGGKISGDGGNAEISSRGGFDFNGKCDLTASKGNPGTVILDPGNITINTNANQNMTWASPNYSADVNPATLNVGTLTGLLNGGSNVNVLTSAGSITVNSAIAFTRAVTLTLTATTGITINAPISSSAAGNITFAAGGSNINLNAGVSSSGGVLSFGSPMFLGASIVVASGGGNIIFSNTINGPQSLTVNASRGTNTGIVTIANAIGGGTALASFSATCGTGTGNIRLGGNITASGAISLNGPVLITGAAVTATSTADNAVLAGQVDAGDAANHDLSVSATSVGHGVTIASDVGTTRAIRNLTIRSNLQFSFPRTTISGILDIIAANGIVQSARLLIGSTSTLESAGSAAITLDNPNNDFQNTVSITNGSAVSLVDVNGITLGACSEQTSLAVSATAITANGVLTATNSGISLTSTNGNTTINAALNASGASGTISVAATNGSVTLDGNASARGTISVTPSDNGITVNPLRSIASSDGNVIMSGTTIVNNGMVSANTTLAVTARGAISRPAPNTGVWSSGSGATFTVDTATGVPIDISGNNAITGPITIEAVHGASISDCNIRNIANPNGGISAIPDLTGNCILSFANTGLTIPDFTIPGTLFVTANGTIDKASGSLIVNLASSFDDTNPANDIELTAGTLLLTGNVSFKNCWNVNIANTVATKLGGSTIGGNFTVTSSGAITQPAGALSIKQVNALSSFSANGNSITLAVAGNDFSVVSVSDCSNASIVDANALDLGACSVSGNLDIVSGGNITDSGQLVVPGNATFTSGASPNNVIELDYNTTPHNLPNLIVTNNAALTIVSAHPVSLSTNVSIASLHMNANPCTLTNSLVVDGELHVTGGTFDVTTADKQVTLSGNWVVDTTAAFNARNGLVLFTGPGLPGIDTGASDTNDANHSFYNVRVAVGCTVSVTNHGFPVANQLLLAGDTSIANLNGMDFDINSLSFNGSSAQFRLNGRQTVQTIGTMDTTTGTVVYTDGGANGAIYLSQFRNLSIQSGTVNQSLGQNITVYGNLALTSGSLSAGIRKITLMGNFDSSGGGNFIAGAGEVELVDTNVTSVIRGNNTFNTLTCTAATAGAAKKIRFANGSATTIDTSGVIKIRGYSDMSRVTLDSESGVGPNWILVVPYTANRNINYVRVYNSTALTYAIVLDENVNNIDSSCVNWWIINPVISSMTLDSDRNGKIDHIRVVVGSTLNEDDAGCFERIVLTVDGYHVSGLERNLNASDPDFPDPVPPAADNVFYIRVDEKPYNDTGVRPSWHIVSNNSLMAQGTVARLVMSTTGTEIPDDRAHPMLSYSLAAAGKNRIFLHFSEPVTRNNGAVILYSDFSYTGSGTNSVLADPFVRVATDSGNGTSEVLLTLSQPVTADDIYGLKLVTLLNTFVDATTTVPPNNISAMTHRVTDIALGMPGQEPITPIWAGDGTETDPVRGGFGLIRVFDDSTVLRNRDIVLQANLAASLAPVSPDTELCYDFNIPGTFVSNGLWLPDFNTRQFNGIVPSPDLSARTCGDSNISSRLRDYLISPSSDATIVSGIDFQFFLRFVTPDLYAGRLASPNAPDWYRSVRPWGFRIHDLYKQRSNVTILNNVINPERGEKVWLHYTLKKAGNVTIQVFDLAGNLVGVICRGNKEAGEHSTSWDGFNRGDRIVARGVYFIKIVGPGIEDVRKVLVVK